MRTASLPGSVVLSASSMSEDEDVEAMGQSTWGTDDTDLSWVEQMEKCLP